MKKYRLAIACDVAEMRALADALDQAMPMIAKGIRNQIQEIQDSEVNVHHPYNVADNDDLVGLTKGEIEFVLAYRE
jgi:hypothetical protein